MSGAAPSPNGNQVFGYDLTEAMLRDGDEVPRVLEMCAEAIEARGAFTLISRKPTRLGPDLVFFSNRLDVDGYLSSVGNDVCCAEVEGGLRPRYVVCKLVFDPWQDV